MPWQLSDAMCARVHHARMLLLTADHAGSESLQNFIAETDTVVALHRFFLDDDGSRRLLTPLEEMQGLVLLLRRGLTELQTPLFYRKFDGQASSAVLSAEKEVFQLVMERRAHAESTGLSFLWQLSNTYCWLLWGEVRRGSDTIATFAPALSSWQHWAPRAAALERYQRQQKLSVCMTASELRQLFLLLSVGVHKKLSKRLASPQANGAAQAEQAARQLVRLFPSTAYYKLALAESLDDLGMPQQAAVAYRSALAAAEARRAYIVTFKAALKLAARLMEGAEGRDWAPTEVQRLLNQAEVAIGMCDAWFPSQDVLKHWLDKVNHQRQELHALAAANGGPKVFRHSVAAPLTPSGARRLNLARSSC